MSSCISSWTTWGARMSIPEAGRAAAAAAALLLAAGCSVFGDAGEGLFGEDGLAVRVPAALEPVAGRVSLAPVWSHSVRGYRGSAARIAPHVDAADVILLGGDGEVVALEAGTGRVRWRRAVAGRVLAGVAADERHVYVGTFEQEVHALDRATGQPAWRRALPSEVMSLAALPLGRVAARTNDGRISLLAAADGEPLWSLARPGPDLTLRGASRPLGADDRVLVGFDDGKLAAFDAASGLLHWETRLAFPSGRTELERMTDIDGELRLVEGVAYATAYHRQTGAVETVEGELLWTLEVKSAHGPAVDAAAAYVADADGAVWAINRRNGGVYWKQEALAYRGLSAPAVAGLQVVVGDFEGYLHWLRILDGEIVARHRLAAPLQAAPVVRGDRLYALDRDGNFSVFQFLALSAADDG